MRCLPFLFFTTICAAQPATQRQVPPAGKVIPEADRAELSAKAAALGEQIDRLKGDALLPDVIVFHKAVDWALRYDEFMDVKHVKTARDLLAEGSRRADELV